MLCAYHNKTLRLFFHECSHGAIQDCQWNRDVTRKRIHPLSPGWGAWPGPHLDWATAAPSHHTLRGIFTHGRLVASLLYESKFSSIKFLGGFPYNIKYINVIMIIGFSCIATLLYMRLKRTIALILKSKQTLGYMGSHNLNFGVMRPLIMISYIYSK